MKRPVGEGGELVVVAGFAAAEEAENVLIDEVEPGEAVAGGGKAGGVPQRGEDVPGGCDDEEEGDAGEGLERAERVGAGEDAVESEGGGNEDEGDEAFGEDGEGEGCPEKIGVEGGGGARCGSLRFAALRLR